MLSTAAATEVVVSNSVQPHRRQPAGILQARTPDQKQEIMTQCNQYMAGTPHGGPGKEMT